MIKDRTGEEKYNYQGLHMKIIKYRKYSDIDVMFDNGYVREHARYSEFKNGTIRNHMIPEIYGIGILGDIKTKENGIFTKEYATWANILQRCYDPKKQEEFPKYKDVTICNEWLYFPNFVEWCHKQTNWDKVLKDRKKFHIDKDIINKGNKIYCPESCCFVPAIVNTLFCKSEALRGDYPIGVSLSRDKTSFRARCNNPITKEKLEYRDYQTPEEAFKKYKEVKEKIIKEIAQEEYNKGNITEVCYKAMMKYEVEITD